MLYLFALMPPFDLKFLRDVFSKEVEKLWNSDVRPDRLVILSGSVGEAMVGPAPDDGYSGPLPSSPYDDAWKHPGRVSVLVPGRYDAESECDIPARVHVQTGSLRHMVETQTESWARTHLTGYGNWVCITRVSYPEEPLEFRAVGFFVDHQPMGAKKGILWSVYRNAVPNHDRLRRCRLREKKGVTWLNSTRGVV